MKFVDPGQEGKGRGREKEGTRKEGSRRSREEESKERKEGKDGGQEEEKQKQQCDGVKKEKGSTI